MSELHNITEIRNKSDTHDITEIAYKVIKFISGLQQVPRLFPTINLTLMVLLKYKVALSTHKLTTLTPNY